MTAKPQLSFPQIWNMCFGFMGIQFGFALQNSNVSRIFQTLGASVDDIPVLWIAAPLTGLLVQPIVGDFSDRTWNGLGRRRPYFLGGAILATLALLAMPNSPTLWVAAGLLWMLDASINISMEPFRAFVGDQLPSSQRPTGYALQSFFIGIGSVVASLLPWLLAQWGVSNTAAPRAVPDTVQFAFYARAVALFGAVGRARAALSGALGGLFVARAGHPRVHLPASNPPRARGHPQPEPASAQRSGWLWFGAGAAALAAVYFTHVDKQLYLLAAGLLAYGA